MNVAMIGLTHPHSDMYLETLDQLADVIRVPLYDPDETVAREVAARFPKADDIYTSLDPLLARADITHALVAVRNDQSVATLVRFIQAGKNVFTENPLLEPPPSSKRSSPPSPGILWPSASRT
jgi:predicted dehydrogenase